MAIPRQVIDNLTNDVIDNVGNSEKGMAIDCGSGMGND
jgi:hypothetical protein